MACILRYLFINSLLTMRTILENDFIGSICCKKSTYKEVIKVRTFTIKLLALFVSILIASTAWSYPMDVLVTDVDPPSTGWWMKADTYDANPDRNLANSGEATEDSWVAGILGYPVNRITKINDPVLGAKFADGYNPNFAWEFVVVKYDGFWALYKDDASNDNRVTVGPFGWGISHMSFYGPTASVPEAATMLLLGVGLLGIAGLRRKRK